MLRIELDNKNFDINIYYYHNIYFFYFCRWKLLKNHNFYKIFNRKSLEGDIIKEFLIENNNI